MAKARIAVQRLEMLEEKLGVSMQAVGADVTSYDDGDHFLHVRAEILTINGGQLAADVSIKFSATDSNGECIATGERRLATESFFGIDTVSFEQSIRSSDVRLVKIFPTR